MATASASSAAVPDSRLGRPDLTERQRQAILTAAGELIRATALAQPTTLSDPTLGGAGEHTVSGIFVSLKRRGHLRSCCGLLGPPVRLQSALHDAAVRTAWEDVRFPPISPTELHHLEMEVWLLYNPEPVHALGEARLGAVTVGKHGLQVVRGQARGLLLPGVPVEHQWDAARFLEQVCVKAGLHPTLWKDDATSLFTFEGEAIRGQVLNGDRERSPLRPAPLLRADELTAYTEFCRGNIAAYLTGATPTYYLTGVTDGHVTGVALTVRRQGGGDDLVVSQVSLRPGVPLQSTLFSLAQAAAQGLGRQQLTYAELDNLQVSVSIFHDSALHGTVADADLAGLDPQSRAVLVMGRSKAEILYDPARRAQELLNEAATHAQVANPAAAAVYSLAVATLAPRVVVSTAPRPVRGPAERPPAVAGMFYPADPAELARVVDQMLTGTPPRTPPSEGGEVRAWSAAMVPHAGLNYSGRIAAAVLQRIKFPSTVIVLGPKHTPLGVDWAVAPHQTWQVPGMTIPSDFVLARQLCEAIPGLQLDAAAHQREHAIEVELPFLARLAPQSKVVGIAIGSGDLDSCRRFAEGLAAVLRQRKEPPLLLISSDMNHFATDAENRRLDELALAALDRLDPEEVYETVQANRISMCGVLPAVIVLETLRLLGGVKKAERVGYATTADVSGDKSRVVGYAGMLFGDSNRER